jgi:hypothetical protein
MSVSGTASGASHEDEARRIAGQHAWLPLDCDTSVFVGALLGIAAQAFLAVGAIFYIMPWIGLGLLWEVSVLPWAIALS